MATDKIVTNAVAHDMSWALVDEFWPRNLYVRKK